MNKSYKMPSGAVVLVNTAPIAAAWKLNDAVLKEVVMSGAFSTDLTSIDEKMSMQLGASDVVRAAAMECASKAVYMAKGEGSPAVPITTALFDDPAVGDQARGDFFSILGVIVQHNMVPFYQARSSAS